jgi:glycosyltransferase involved in cell wall biosynthesis
MSRLARKVLHVMNGAAGGAALSTLGLIETLRARGIESCAVCDDRGSAAEKDAIRDAVAGRVRFVRLYWWNKKIRSAAWKRPIHELRQILSTGAGMASTASVAQLALRERADLIHTNTLLTPEGGLAARLLGLPHVWHVRELVGPSELFQLPRAGAALGALLARRASAIVANSEQSAARLRAYLPDGLLEVVPNGIDVDRFARARTARPAGAPLVVAMVGNLTSRCKKHALFIDAATQLRRAAGANVEFRIYGHAPFDSDAYSRNLRDLAAGRVAFPGFATNPVTIMRDIDVLVHPADQESFGRVVVEAMAAGVPVVGVRGGGVGDIVVDGETGLLAPPDDASALAACVSRLVEDAALRARLGDAGRRRAHDRYSLAACADKIAAVYERASQRPLGWRAKQLWGLG